jgi:hypothetical protein
MTFKDKPKQLFSAQQLLEINSSATNLANSAMFEAGILALGGDRYVGQEEGALLPHMKQMLRVLPLKFIMEMITEQEKEKVSGKESDKEENDK